MSDLFYLLTLILRGTRLMLMLIIPVLLFVLQAGRFDLRIVVLVL